MEGLAVNLPDIINGCFEAGGFLSAISNVRALLRDKQVKGIYWQAWCWFTAWGFWNVYYYWHLSQFFSWAAGIGLAVTNLTWLAILCYYAATKGKSSNG